MYDNVRLGRGQELADVLRFPKIAVLASRGYHLERVAVLQLRHYVRTQEPPTARDEDAFTRPIGYSQFPRRLNRNLRTMLLEDRRPLADVNYSTARRSRVQAIL